MGPDGSRGRKFQNHKTTRSQDCVLCEDVTRLEVAGWPLCVRCFNLESRSRNVKIKECSVKLKNVRINEYLKKQSAKDLDNMKIEAKDKIKKLNIVERLKSTPATE